MFVLSNPLSKFPDIPAEIPDEAVVDRETRLHLPAGHTTIHAFARILVFSVLLHMYFLRGGYVIFHCLFEWNLINTFYRCSGFQVP